MKVIFVCTGNTCRSPMAEVIFNSLNTNTNNIAYSAGINAIAGESISKNSAIVIKENLNLDLSNRNSILLTKELLKECDLVLTMTLNQKNFLHNTYLQFSDKIYTLNEFVNLNEDIIDPYGENLMIYTNTFKTLKNSISLLIKKLEKDNSITKN